MVTRKSYREIEHLTGVGKVFDSDNQLSEVDYEIRVQQEMTETTTMDGSTHTTEGLKDIKGRINPLLNSDIALMGLFDNESLTLVMEDGRKLDFFLKNNDGTIANRSGIYGPSSES